MFNYMSNKSRLWFLLFFHTFPKLGHGLYGAASNYQSYGKIEGERSEREMNILEECSVFVSKQKREGRREQD